MSKRLFVAGLPYSLTSQQLNEMFSKFGKVNSADVISDKFTGQSKGFGFVEMDDAKDADKAIKELHDSEVDGRKIVVNEARPREDKPSYNRNNDRNQGRQSRNRGGRRY